MTDRTRPFLAVYVVSHPGFDRGLGIADAIRAHFSRNLHGNVAGGTGLSVLYRFVEVPGGDAPLAIDLDEAETTAVVVLSDLALTSDLAWVDYVRELVERTEATGLGTRVFPVSVVREALAGLGIAEQALRWDRWEGDDPKRTRRLIAELTYEFCRMLRHYLEHLLRPEEEQGALLAYLRKVQIFLSHSKHDGDGERIALDIRTRLHAGHGLSSFFDVHDIPAGLRFQQVLLEQVRVSAMVAIHTDEYSSREWCRREVIEAKRWNVPLIVANGIGDRDERGFPYMGNVPIVRLDPGDAGRIDIVIGYLLDEVLKDFLWRCKVELAKRGGADGVVFVPRPPELIMLAELPTEDQMANPIIVYPDPPMSAEEERLFAAVAPRVQLRSFTEWLAGAVR